MANSVCDVLLTEKPLATAASDSGSYTDVDLAAGAIVDFWGVVRELEDGRAIEGIEYEAHAKMAEHQMELIATEGAEKFQLKGIVLHHRIGFVPAGEASLFLRLSAGHRAAAFEASKWVVDELKKKVPIWKKPRFRGEAQRRAADTAATTV